MLKSFCWYRYVPSIKLLDQYRYEFFRDENECLSTYTVEPIGANKVDKTEPDVYKVRVKRK